MVVMWPNLDHLYKHFFAVARVMDHNDYSYLTSAEKVTAEINKGWEKFHQPLSFNIFLASLMGCVQSSISFDAKIYFWIPPLLTLIPI